MPDPAVFLPLVVIAFIAGFVSSIAGAGGVLTLPALLWAGLPPISALATNKLQSTLGTLSSTWNFFRKGHLDLKPLLPSMATAFIGSCAGTLTVQQVGNETLSRLIPALLIVIGLYFLITPRVTDEHREGRLTHMQFAFTAAPLMGFYGGFFGPGMGSIFPFLMVWLMGYGLRKATAQTKAMVLAVNGVSATIFIIGGHVIWPLAIAMSLAQIIGARLGSNLVISRGAALVQPVIIAVTLIVALKLLVAP
ncbi:MAG: TSUP family transporter [Porticoccaceae bacterium]